jgi:hypothetical protein
MTAAWIQDEEDECVHEAIVAKYPDWAEYIDLLIIPPDWSEVVEEFPECGRSSLKSYEHRVTSYGIPCLALYVKMRREGTAHKFAEMVATQAGPVLSTDDTFFAGFGTVYDQFQSQKHLKRYVDAAKKQGFTPGVNDVYMPGLAQRPGDPAAWVSRAQGRGYIRRLLESRGYECNGKLSEIVARPPEDDPLAPKNCKPLGEDIIRRNIAKYQASDPSLRNKSRRELREMVIEKHSHKIH